jgi:type I restriction enzyme S subunit
MTSEMLSDIALITPGTSPKGELINSEGLGLPFFQGSKEFQAFYPRAERFTEFPVKVAMKDDILISVRAPVGQVNLAPQDVAIGRGVMSVRPKRNADRFFIFYLLKWLEGRWDSLGSTGSVFENLSVSALSAVEIPKVEHREEIGRVLFQIDCKIQENSRISNTLEQIAQSMFKSWFIDFDPVKAKMAGEKPVGIDGSTAALFPNLMEESELGPIPKGWKLSQIGEEVECVGGSTPSTSNPEFWDGDVYWTTPKDLSRQVGLVTTSSERRITSKGLQKISSGVLPVHSVLMSSRAPIGYLSITAVPSAINQGFIALRHNPRFAPLYLLFWLQMNMAEIKNRAGGGTFAEISKSAFKSIPFVVPDGETLQKFDEISKPILLQLTALSLQNQELIELRDALLPRLISGELQIPEEMLVS